VDLNFDAYIEAKKSDDYMFGDYDMLTDKQVKRRDALTIFIESVHKPDSRLRGCAHNQECYNELMEWREEVLEYLNRRRTEEFP
jgi:hypothetical protein